ncbi:MAG: damage-inducible protein DinB [Adhaeribacter sp.]|nr:damage-inducible protein DinB [Adhaeribacter sp.]
MANEYLENALHELGLITKKVQAEFGKLSVDQLNWKPAADSWSIGQCLDHLIKTNRLYFPIFEAVSQGRKKRTFWEMLPGFPGIWGRMMLKGMASTTKKYKTPAVFKPAASNIPASIVVDFVQHQQDLTRRIKAASNVDHAKTIVTSPASPVITYSLQDCINICAVHEERHFLQGKRVMKQKDFPGQQPVNGSA